MEIGIRLISLPLSFSPAQLYKHTVYAVSFGRQTVPDAGEAGEDENLNDIGLYSIRVRNEEIKMALNRPISPMNSRFRAILIFGMLANPACPKCN